MTVEPGIELTTSYEIQQHHTTGHAGAALFATPSMIGLMEVVCMEAVQPHLEKDQTTVGIHVCVSHEKPATPGETVEISCQLTEVDGRKLQFDVEARIGDRILGRGTHRRAVMSFT